MTPMPGLPGSHGLWMNPGMMPILHWPGVMTPGQFGPTSRTPGFALMYRLAFAMSRTGTPSVMATMSVMPASAASMSASAAQPGGTNTMLAVAPVSLTAWATVLNTGSVLPDFSPV